MRLFKSFRVEECCIHPKSDRKSLLNAWLDVPSGTLTASDGSCVTTAPVEVSDDDRSGWVTPDALRMARKLKDDGVHVHFLKIDLSPDFQVVGPTTITRPGGEIPPMPYDRVQSDVRAGDPHTVSITLDPALLLNIARALGAMHTGVTLTVSSLTQDSLIAIVPNRDDDVNLRATLMPMKVFRTMK